MILLVPMLGLAVGLLLGFAVHRWPDVAASLGALFLGGSLVATLASVVAFLLWLVPGVPTLWIATSGGAVGMFLIGQALLNRAMTVERRALSRK